MRPINELVGINKMKKLFYILILFPLLTSGQINDNIPKYFPPKTFDCNKELDDKGNHYWSGFLYNAKKLNLYQDTTFSVYYRLLYYGNYMAIIEVYKNFDNYILAIDSLANDNKLYRQINTVISKNNLSRIDSLDILSGQFFKIRSYENCYDDNKFLSIDDRDNWVIEIKKQNKYHAIERTLAEENVARFIKIIMDIGNMHQYHIYRSDKK